MRSKPFIGILIFTFIVIIIWIGSNIYHATKQVMVDPSIQKLLDPIDPNFDQDTLNKIKNAPSLPLNSASPSAQPSLPENNTNLLNIGF